MPYVQSARSLGVGTATTIAVAFGSNVTAGGLIAVAASWDLGTAGAPVDITATVADSLGNTYSAAVDTIQSTGQDPNRRSSTFYAKNITGGACTVTVTFSATATNRKLLVHEVSGADPTAPLSANAAQFQSSPGLGTNAVTSGAVTPSADGSYIFGASCGNTSGSDAFNAGTGFTQRQSLGGENLVSEDQMQTTAASVAATFTLVGAGNVTLTHLMAFKPPGAAFVPNTRQTAMVVPMLWTAT